MRLPRTVAPAPTDVHGGLPRIDDLVTLDQRVTRCRRPCPARSSLNLIVAHGDGRRAAVRCAAHRPQGPRPCRPQNSFFTTEVLLAAAANRTPMRLRVKRLLLDQRLGRVLRDFDAYVAALDRARCRGGIAAARSRMARARAVADRHSLDRGVRDPRHPAPAALFNACASIGRTRADRANDLQRRAP